MALAVALLLAGLTAWGIFHEHLFAQPVWTSAGLRGLSVFAVCTVAAAVWRPRWLTPILIGGAALGGAWAVGPVAIVAAPFFFLSCWSLGRLAWPKGDDPWASTALGLALWITLFGWLVRFPINAPWVWWILLAAPIVLAGRPRWGRPQVHPLILLPLVALFLLALQPEVSGDGLAMHLVIPSRIAAHARWSFDVTEFAWAVMPMGGDWAYSIAFLLGGEAAARLTDFGALCVLSGLLARRAPALAVAGFLSLPLVQLVTGSLFVENIWALLLAGALVALDAGAALPCAVMAGAALAAKFGALPLAVPLVVLAAVRARSIVPIAVMAICAAQPYLDAWLRTGNPVFPFLNHFFQSPFFDAKANFVDVRFARPLSWRLPYDLNFRSDRFIEGGKGAFGFQWLLLLPLAVLGWRRGCTKVERLALALGLFAMVAGFAAQSNLRYLYGALAILTLALAIPLRAWPWTRWLMGAAVALNFCFWAVANGYHKDFVRNPGARQAILAELAPTRFLVDGRAEPVALLNGNEVGLLKGRAYVNSWHNAAFQAALLRTTSAEELGRLFRDRGIALWVAPSTRYPNLFAQAHAYDLARGYSDVVATAGFWTLYRLRSGGHTPDPQPQPPGAYDELNEGTRYDGPWVRDLQFPETYQHSLMYCAGPPCTAEFHFDGGALTLLYTAAFNRGRARLLLDGKPAGMWDQHTPDTRWQQRHQIVADTRGPHVLRIEVEQGYIDVDGFLVTIEK